MQRYYIKDIDYINKKAKIEGPDVHHIRNVMRLNVGDKIILNTYEGRVFEAEIFELSKTYVICALDKEISNDYKPLNLTLAMSLIKKDNFELVLQKATELGVKAIIPINTERSIIKINDYSRKLERFETIVKEASEQCERTVPTNIDNLIDLDKIDFLVYDHVILAYEREKSDKKFSDIIRNIDSKENVLVIIGPEGGFSDAEVGFLKTKPVEFTSLGKTILRAETAAIYVVSAFKLMWEN